MKINTNYLLISACKNRSTMKFVFCTLLSLSLFFVNGNAQIVRIDTLAREQVRPPKQKHYSYNAEYLYTIGVKAYGYEQFPRIFNESSPQPLYSSVLNGLVLKINDNQLSYRLAGSYFKKDLSVTDSDCQSCNDATPGNFENTNLKIGVEKNLIYARLQPYIGADIGFIRQKFERHNTGAMANGEGLTDEKTAGVISPFLGLKINIVPWLAIVGEANMNVAFGHQKTMRSSISLETAAPERSETKGYNWDYYFAPVAALSLQFSFGSIY